MKANITIQFQEILGIKVDDALLKKEPRLMKSTSKTIEILCEQIKKYFADKKIKTKVGFDLEEIQ
jgi:hypothetical protein